MTETEAAETPQARESVDRLALATIGWLAQAAEGAEALADELAASLGVDRDEALTTVRGTLERWRDGAGRMADRGQEHAERVTSRVGWVTREQMDELALRVAQVEHRLKLLERGLGGSGS